MFLQLRYSIICEPPDAKMDIDSLRLHRIGYYYLYVRLSDYFDTVFFVLAKKQSHVTFLHVYHHLCVCLNGWLYMRQGEITVCEERFTSTSFTRNLNDARPTAKANEFLVQIHP